MKNGPLLLIISLLFMILSRVQALQIPPTPYITLILTGVGIVCGCVALCCFLFEKTDKQNG